MRYLSDPEVAVLDCIRQFNREKCDPTKKEIADRLGKSQTTIHAILLTLFDLTCIVRYGNKTQKYFVPTRIFSVLDIELRHVRATEIRKAS